jgi:hypothetical protein
MRHVSAALALAGMLVGAPGASAQSPTAPYVDPPFGTECTFHHFDEGEAPPLDACTDDPLCVEYEKRDITVENGGAIRFLAAEPARFAIAIPKCRYWQRDHWRIQLQAGSTPLVGWDGSYWFNKGNGTGAARLRNFTINGQPADPEPVAALLDLIDPELAAVVRMYGDSPEGGGGSAFILGEGEPTCQASSGGACENDPAVSMARAAADAECGCSQTSRAEYRRCIEDFTASEAQSGAIPAECAAKISDCAERSTCSRPPGAVVCYRTNARGTERCKIKRDESACRAPRGGSASLGYGPTCCDPKTVEGCQ